MSLGLSRTLVDTFDRYSVGASVTRPGPQYHLVDACAVRLHSVIKSLFVLSHLQVKLQNEQVFKWWVEIKKIKLGRLQLHEIRKGCLLHDAHFWILSILAQIPSAPFFPKTIIYQYFLEYVAECTCTLTMWQIEYKYVNMCNSVGESHKWNFFSALATNKRRIAAKWFKNK